MHSNHPAKQRAARGPVVAILALLVACGWLLGLACRCGLADEKSRPPQTPKAKPRITVSVNTTRILQPLDREGYVDYVAALNQMASQGVTPENNAGVLFVRALGMTAFEAVNRARFFKLLQIDPLPEEGNYLSDFAVFVRKKTGRAATKKELDDFGRSSEELWTRSDYPLVAEWLTASEMPLELIIAGTRRSKCYIPIVVSEHEGLMAALLPTAQAARTAARALAARAMLRLGTGKNEEAKQDLLGCHRLGRMIGNLPFIIESLVGIAIDSVACHCDGLLIESSRLTADQAIAYRKELDKLPNLPVVAKQIDCAERFCFIDTVSLMVREDSNPLDTMIGVSQDSLSSKLIGKLVSAHLKNHADEVLQFGNERFDKAVAAARQPTFADRKRAFEALDRELAADRSEFGDAARIAVWLSFGNPRNKTPGQQLGKLIVSLLMPSVRAVSDAESRTRTRETLGQLGFTLAAFHADHGAYPAHLSELEPRYIAPLPKDLYTEQPLQYRRGGGGFLLYSVGANGVDGGGRTFDSQPPGDDVVLRITPNGAKKQKPAK